LFEFCVFRFYLITLFGFLFKSFGLLEIYLGFLLIRQVLVKTLGRKPSAT